MAYDDVLMNSGVVVPTIAETRDQDDGDTVENTSGVLRQIFVLFDTGRLHIIDIMILWTAIVNLIVKVMRVWSLGNEHFPIAGVRRYTGTNPETAGTTSK